MSERENIDIDQIAAIVDGVLEMVDRKYGPEAVLDMIGDSSRYYVQEYVNERVR